MAYINTIQLSGGETAAEIVSCRYVCIRNRGTGTVYASRSHGITKDSEGVLPIEAGESVVFPDCGKTLYLLGSGKVSIVCSDIDTNFFKCAPAGGGSGTVDQTARDAINAHAGNTGIHTTAAEVAALVSNPNLLINPDFAVNQRGQNTYSAGYTVDCWKLFGSASATVNSGGSVTFASDGSEWAELRQTIEKGFSERLDGKILSLSAMVDGVLYCGTSAEPFDKTKNYTPLSIDCGDFSISLRNIPTNQNSLFARIGSSKEVNIIIEFIKLEIGSKATVFCPPNPAEEILKCQRYYQLRSTGDIAAVDLCPTMHIISDIKQREDGKYEYISEL